MFSFFIRVGLESLPVYAGNMCRSLKPSGAVWTLEDKLEENAQNMQMPDRKAPGARI